MSATMNRKFNTEEILNSLDGIDRAEPRPFLFTRIQARMMQEERLPELAVLRFITRPAFVVSLCLVFISINSYVAINREEYGNTDEISQPIAAEYVQPDALPYDSNENP
jgi:hypothetical protein